MTMKVTCAVLLGLALACAGREIATPPQADHVFPAWGSISGPAAVDRLFVPGQNTPKAAWSEKGYVVLPVNFSEARDQRVTWDIKLNLDLRTVKAVQFDFFCKELAPFTYFSLYFRSGKKGWYHATFTPDRQGVWQRIVVDKSDLQNKDGSVAGWDKIDTVRISGWRLRDEDTVCAIANLGFVGGKAEILVVRADSQASKGGAEANSFARYASNVSTTLDALGVSSAQVSDINLTAEMLDGIRLVVLPYNPAVPAETVTALKNFMARDGRLLACYALPKETSGLVGVNNAGAVVPEGGFSGFARTAHGLRAQPMFAPQASWRTTLAKPIDKDNARVVATWLDSQGADTRHPAITITPNSAFVGHVWLGGDEPSVTLMRALIGELVPGFWRQTAERALERIGAVGGASGLDALRATLSKSQLTRPARRELTQAASLRDKAKALYEAGEWDSCFAISAHANEAALKAWMLTRAPQRDEHRAFWCHSAFGLRGKNWDESIRFLAENGFNVILPNMLWGGVAFYPSSVLPEYGDLDEKGDQLKECLTACKKYGVQCHVWKVNWNMDYHAPKEFIQRMIAEGRVQKNADVRSDRVWLCPSHPANQDLEVESMLEIVRKYPVDGIHFDYIRYPDMTSCHCDGCRQRFGEKIGREFKKWPDDLRDGGDVWNAWLDFRRAGIDTVVRRVSAETRKIRPGTQVSAAVFRNWITDRDSVAQDWKMWCEQGWLDFVCPMNYVDSNAAFRNMIHAQRDYVGKARLYPGISLSCWKDPRDPVKLAEQIEVTREFGLGGFTVFNFDANAETVLPFMRLGVTAEPSWRLGLWPFK